MANPQRGEIAITVNDVEYTLRLSMNAAASIEAKLRKSIGTLLDEAARLDFNAIRLMVWVLLQKHHKDQFKTVEQAGDLIDDAGGVAVFFNALQQLAKVNEPEKKEGAENPPDAQVMG